MGRRSVRNIIANSLFWLLGLGLVLFLFVFDRHDPAGRGIIKITGIDAVAYYAVSHSLLFDRDFDLSNQFERLEPVPSTWNRTVEETGMRSSPFPIGFSLAQLPFLAAGHGLGLIVNGEDDGYSRSAICAYFIGIVFYLCLGLTFLFKFLCLVRWDAAAEGPKTDIYAALSVLALIPASSLGYYSFSPMPHTCAFMASSLVLYAWWRAKDSTSISGWLFCGAALGLVVLCRWQTALFVVIPFGYDLVKWYRQRPASFFDSDYVKTRAVMIAAMVLLFIPQGLEWKAIYGSFFTIPQGQDFLQFPPRHVLDVLFSSNHGFFVWTPITFIGVIGLVVGIKRYPELGLPFLTALFLQVVMIGSLSMSWNNPTSFGIRMLISSLPIIAFGINQLLHEGKRYLRGAVIAGIVLCSVYTFVFMIQFRVDMIPDDGRLTARELLYDKVLFHKAWARRQDYHRALMYFEQGGDEQALQLLRGGRWHQDRNTLKLIIDIHQQRGDEERRRQAEYELEKLLDSRLM